MSLRLPAPSQPHRHTEQTIRLLVGCLAAVLGATSIALVGVVNHLHAEGAQAGMRFWLSEGLLAFAAAIAVGLTTVSGPRS